MSSKEPTFGEERCCQAACTCKHFSGPGEESWGLVPAHNSEPCQRAEEDKWRIGNAAEVGLKLVSTARNEHAIIVQTGMSETPW